MTKSALLKAAETLRKLGSEHNKVKMQKCAKVMLGAASIQKIMRKIRGI